MAQPLPAGSARSASSRWLLSVLPAFPDLLTIVDSSGAIDYVSPSVTPLLGHRAELLLGHRACKFLPDEDVRNAAGWLRHAVSHDDAPQFVHRLARSDHTFGWFESSLQRLDTAGGSRVVVASRDITDRRAVDSHLAASALMWRNIADVLPEAVLIVDGDGAVVAVNQPAAELFNMSRQVLVGRNLRELVQFETTGHQLDGSWGMVGQGIGGRLNDGGFTASTLCSDGGVHRVRGRACPLPDDADSDPAGRTAVLLWPVDGLPVNRNGKRLGAACDGEAADSLHQLLSPREVDVLRLLADGLDVHEVSSRLNISIHTTRNYVKSVLHKLNAHTQLQAVVIAIRAGFVELS